MTSEFTPPPGSPEALSASASRLRQLAGSLSVDTGGIGAQVAVAHTAWRGPRSNDFLAAGDGVRDQLDDASLRLGDLAGVVGELAHHLERATLEVAELRARADLLADVPPVREQLVHLAAEVRRDYRTVAHRLAARIDGLCDDAVAGVLTAPDVGVDGGAGPDWGLLAGWLTERDSRLPDGIGSVSPTRVARWWSGLVPGQRVALLREHPAALGNLDGLPGWARDLANRVQLPRLRARLDHELAHPSPFTGFEGDGVIRELDRWSPALRQKRAALDAVEAALARGGRQLLTLDAARGRLLHAAVAVGDVDTADNVAVFVPGYTTRVESSLLAYDHEMAALKNRADQAAYRFAKGRAPRTTAFVAWLGYDAPQPADLLGGPLSVGSAHLAREGGDALAVFLRGINAARPHDPHLVTLGHSYGSTATGYALRHAHTGVDDAVVFGSPGLGVSRVSELRVPRGHVFALEADGDKVADLPRFGGVDPDHLPGVTLLSADADPDGRTAGSTGHSAYLTERSTSQQNIALVSLGHPEKAVLDARQPFSLLSLAHP